MRRLWEHLNRATGEMVALPAAEAALIDVATALAQRLAQAGQYADRNDVNVIIALDGLDKLSGEQNLRSMPRTLAPRIKLVVSSLDGAALQAAEARHWVKLKFKPLPQAARALLVARMLEAWGRKLSSQRAARILAHPLSGHRSSSKSFSRSCAFPPPMNASISASTSTSEPATCRTCSRACWSGRRRTTAQTQLRACLPRCGRAAAESELIVVAGVAPLAWAHVHNGALRDQQGHIKFSHDFRGRAVRERYAPTPQAQRAVRLKLTDHFERGPRDARQPEEVPYQLRAAEAWERS